MKKKTFHPVIASSVATVPKKPVTAAYECKACSYDFALTVESSVASDVKPFCIMCGSNSLKRIEGASYRKVSESALNVAECGSCETVNLIPNAVLSSKELRNGSNIDVCCSACGTELAFKLPEGLDDEEAEEEVTSEADEVDELEDDDTEAETAEVEFDDEDEDEEEIVESDTEIPSKDEIEYAEGDDNADMFAQDVGPGADAVDDQEEMADKTIGDGEVPLPKEVTAAKKKAKVKKVKAEVAPNADTTNEHPAGGNKDAKRYGEQKGLTEVKKTTDTVLKDGTPDKNDQPRAGDLPSAQPQAGEPVKAFLDTLVKGDITLARLNENTVAAFKGDYIVAYLSRSDTKVEAGQFNSLNYLNSMKLALAKNGFEATLADFGFDRVAVEVSANIVTKAKVAEAVEAAKKQVKAELATTKKEVEHALKIAIAGINKGFFAKRSNALVASLTKELSRAGFRDAAKVVEKAFRDSHDEFARTVVDVTADLLGKTVDMRNEYAQAIGSAEYVVSDVEEIDDAKAEEVDEVESALEQPIVASVEHPQQNGNKTIQQINASVGGLFRN